MTTEPQVSPAPTALMRTTEPGLSRPSSTASASASGIDADDVLPYRSMFTTHLVVRQAHVLRGVVDDPLVGLVRHVEIDVVELEARTRSRSSRADVTMTRVAKRKTSRAVHLDELGLLGQALGRGGHPGAAGRDAEIVAA